MASVEETKDKNTVMYTCTETFLSEQVESIVNNTILDENATNPISYTNIENTVKAITEFLVICQRTNCGKNKSTMYKQLQLSLQGRDQQTVDPEDVTNYEKYYCLQYTVYEKLYQTNKIYALFCMPTLNNLASHYLNHNGCPEKARKCLNNVLTFHQEYKKDEQKLPEKFVKHTNERWVKNRIKNCLDVVEYFYTASLKICSQYYDITKNYRMSMKVGLRYLRRLCEIHTKTMNKGEWIETATDLAVTCVQTRALPQSVYLLCTVISLLEKMEEDIRKEEQNNCGHMTRINNEKRKYLKHLRTELNISVIRVALWILEESFLLSNAINSNNNTSQYDLYETAETFTFIKIKENSYPLPMTLCLEPIEFAALLKEARNLLKLHKKNMVKLPDWSEIQTRVQKIGQMRI